MAFETLLYDVRDRVAYITLNRPEHGNALNEQMHHELHDAWGRVNDDDNVWAVVVQGAGNDFCIGEDAQEVAEAYQKGGKVARWAQDEAWVRKIARPPIVGWPRPMDGMPAKPLVTVVHGRCHGTGLMFVASNAFTLAADNAEFSLPNVHQGTVPVQEILVLTRTMARSPVLRLALLGKHDKWTADRARQLGLVLETAPSAKVQQRLGELLDMLVNRAAPLAVRAGFVEWWQGFDLPAWEKREVAGPFSSEVSVVSLDFKEGPRAFAEKRQPRWQAR